VHAVTACPVHLDAGRRRQGPPPPVRFEPLDRGDVVTVRQVFDQLSPRSRNQRFLTAKPRLTSADLRSLTDVDGRDHVALVARDEAGHAVGIARFVRDRDDPATAEVAVTVVDAWQDRGLGTRLAQALRDRALELGVTRISLAMAQDNDAAVRLMHRIAGDVTRVGWDGGTVEFEVRLEEPRLPEGRPGTRRTVAFLKAGGA
jgi:RimJ/RimL family protein N-acetyltransferase